MSGKDFRVATLSELYLLTISEITMQCFNSLIQESTIIAIRYCSQDRPKLQESFAFKVMIYNSIFFTQGRPLPLTVEEVERDPGVAILPVRRYITMKREFMVGTCENVVRIKMKYFNNTLNNLGVDGSSHSISKT